MKITILGSGTCVPSLKRSAAAALIETGSSRLLIDVGPGTMRRLLECGLTIFDVTHVLITHFHPDHVAELVPLIFATKYPDAARRRHPLTIAGAPGLIRFYHDLQVPFGHWISLPDDRLRFFEFPDTKDACLTLDGCRITAHSVSHSPESRAYRLESPKGKVVTYSGDTDCCIGLVEAARSADLMICECAYPDEMKVTGHLTPGLAGDMARRAGAGRLVLTHLYPPCDQADIVKQAEKGYQNGPVLVAEDLMSFDLDAMER
jgi:ribonuclease BN (tRNA processing enzyme)